MSASRIKDPYSLADLPKVIRQGEIYPRWSVNGLGLLSQTSKQYAAETRLLRLSLAALYGAPAVVSGVIYDETTLPSMSLLQKRPDLLFKKKKLTNHLGRIILASPYQIFLAAGDIWALNTVDKNIIPQVENGVLQADTQFKENFFFQRVPDYENAKDKFYLTEIDFLKKNPRALFEKKWMKDFSGEKIFRSHYQILLRSGKVWVFKQIYINTLPLIENGMAQAKDQFIEMFPRYAKERNEEDEEALCYLAVIPLLKKYPELLFEKTCVTDHYGREICASPYQILLGAGDIWALKQIYKDIIPLIENGMVKATSQFHEQFPNYDKNLLDKNVEARFYDDRNKQQIAAIEKQLVIVKQLIEIDPFIDKKPLATTKEAIETLCKLFQPQSGEVIRSGLHFPLTIIKKIYKIYYALKNIQCREFFSLAVIKPALDALPTIDGQCCQNGLENLDMEKGPNRRCHPSFTYPLGKPLSLSFVQDKNKKVAMLVDPVNGDILFDYPSHDFICFFNKKAQTLQGLYRILSSRGMSYFENLIAYKSKNLWKLFVHALRREYTNTMENRFFELNKKRKENPLDAQPVIKNQKK